VRDHTIGQHTIEKHSNSDHADPHAVDPHGVDRPHADDRADAVTEPLGPLGPIGPEPTEPPAEHRPPNYRPADEPPASEPVPEPQGWLGAARTHLPFALVLLVAAVGIFRMVLYHWRQGAALVGGALVLAAVFRALLPDRRAGLLAVRGRPVDVLSYVGLGAFMLFVAGTIQGGPFG
jgi:hypothetical protein